MPDPAPSWVGMRFHHEPAASEVSSIFAVPRAPRYGGVMTRSSIRSGRSCRARRRGHLAIAACGLAAAAVTGTGVLAGPATASIGKGRVGSASGTSVSWQRVGPRDIGGLTHGASGGGAGKLQAFAVDQAKPAVMYAAGGVGPGNAGPGSEAGIYKTTDGGTAWAPADSSLTDPAVDTLWLDQKTPSVLLAGTWDAGIFRSTTSGKSWSLVASLGAVTSFVQSGSDLYAATSSGVARSTNTGQTWTVIKTTPARCGRWQHRVPRSGLGSTTAT